MASSIWVTFAKWAVLGMPRQRIPKNLDKSNKNNDFDKYLGDPWQTLKKYKQDILKKLVPWACLHSEKCLWNAFGPL